MNVFDRNEALYMQTKLLLLHSFQLVEVTMCKIQYRLSLHAINPLSATHHFGITFNVASNVNS